MLKGFNDLLIGATSALGSLSSGVLFAVSGYALVGIAGAILSLIPLGLTWVWSRPRVPAMR